MHSEYYLYTTAQGDTFDIMALMAYNDEFKAHIIMQANPQFVNQITFESGIEIKIPILEDAAEETLPPWKR